MTKQEGSGLVKKGKNYLYWLTYFYYLETKIAKLLFLKNPVLHWRECRGEHVVPEIEQLHADDQGFNLWHHIFSFEHCLEWFLVESQKWALPGVAKEIHYIWIRSEIINYM